MVSGLHRIFLFFFFNDTATTEIYTLSLHDALPISVSRGRWYSLRSMRYRGTRRSSTSSGSRESFCSCCSGFTREGGDPSRSEEHTSELQSRSDLVCRLLLEKKKESLSPDTTHTSEL